MIGNIATIVGFLSFVIVWCINKFDTATQLVGALQ